jgi:class 3 adenylate cyclase
MPSLDARTRANLKDSAFAYVDSRGQRRLPIHDAPHVRNALARFEQVAFESVTARERAREKLLRAAAKFGVVPVGFVGAQLEKERTAAQLKSRAAEMARWPRGNVTFLLTDIEGSTKLLRELGDGYAVVLRDIRTLIRANVRKSGGYEVDSRADEYFAAFAKPARALGAAIAIQMALARKSWPDCDEVRVRIGLHSGRSSLTDSGYVGIAVHTAARVCDAGHGGQILLSSATALALGEQATVTLRTLGRYRLDGLAEPEELHQVLAEGLLDRFPRLRARAAANARKPAGVRGQ